MAEVKKNVAGSEALANVLIVDDRESDLELTQFMLQEKAKVQCNVTLARGGQEALNILRDKNQPVDLVLLDINMPGMDGFEILEIIRKEKLLPQSSVIMCTGSTYEQDILNAKAMGAAGYLVKPAGLMTLEPIINQIESVKLQAGEGNYRLLRAA